MHLLCGQGRTSGMFLQHSELFCLDTRFLPKLETDLMARQTTNKGKCSMSRIRTLQIKTTVR